MDNEELVKIFQDGTGNQKEILSMLWENVRGLSAVIARKYSTPEEFNDSMQQGFLGMYEAARNYDPEEGASFSSYAFHWIRQSMTRYRNENTAAVRLPSHIAEKKIRYKQFLTRYQVEHGHEPDEREICFCLNLTPADIEGILAAIQIENADSTDSLIPGADDLTIGDMIRDPADMIENTDDRLWNEQLAKVLWELVDGLDPEQAYVIKTHYQNEITMPEIDGMRGWKKGRANSLKVQAFRSLRYGKARRILLPFLPDRESPAALRGTVGNFKRTWTSATERTALKLCGVDLEERKRSYLKSGF